MSPYCEEAQDVWDRVCVGTVADSPSWARSQSHPRPNTGMRVKRLSGDFRTQPFEPPLAVESSPAKPLDIVKQRQGFPAVPCLNS